MFNALDPDRGSRTRSIAFVGLSIALIAVSAWIVVPLGPVPFTLQMLSISFVICLLTPKEAIATICCYELLGAIGVPVFSGMRGGIGVLLGPTGGFLVGYLIGVPLAVGFLYVARRWMFGDADGAGGSQPSSDPVSHVRGRGFMASRGGLQMRSTALGIIAGIIFTLTAYFFGTIQYTFVAGVPFEVAFLTSVAPFIVPDMVKIVIGAVCAQSVMVALGATSVERSSDRA